MLKRKTVDKRFVDYVFLAGLPSDFRIKPKEQNLSKENETIKESNIKERDSEKNNVTEKEGQVQKTKEIDQTSLNSTTFTDTTTTTATTTTTTTNTTVKFAPNSKENKTSSEVFKSKNIRTLSSPNLIADDDDESMRLLDSIWENINAFIMRFDQEHDEFLESLGSKRKSHRKSSNNNNNNDNNDHDKNNDDGNNNNNDNDHDDGDDGTKREPVTTLSTKLFKNSDEDFLEADSVQSFSSNDASNVDNNRSSYQNVVPQQPSSKQNDVSPDTLLHPLKQKFSPKLLSRYPKNDYPKEGAFPAYVPMVI